MKGIDCVQDKFYVVTGRVFNGNKLVGIRVYEITNKDNKIIGKDKFQAFFTKCNVLNCKYDNKGLHEIDNKYSITKLPRYDYKGRLVSGNNKEYISGLIVYFIQNYIKVSGSRITNIDNEDAEEIARNMYEGFKRRDREQFVANIAKNTGIESRYVDMAYQHVFIDKHWIQGEKEFRTFRPDYAMAQSFMRLSRKDGNDIMPHDITMIKHEIIEYKTYRSKLDKYRKRVGGEVSRDICEGYMKISHDKANEKYNYGKEVREYYKKKGMFKQ